MATSVPPELNKSPPLPTSKKQNGTPPSVRNRAAVLAEMADVESPVEKKADPPADAKAEAPETAEPSEAAETDEVEASKAEPEQEDDEETTRGKESIKAYEKRTRLELAKEREEFVRERESHRAEMKADKDRIAEFERIARRAKYDPMSVFRALGVPDDEFADISRMLYASSPDAAKDPKNREAVARLAKQKEDDDKLRAMEERQAKLEEQLKTEREQAAIERTVGQFIDKVVKVVSDETPMVKRLNDRNPDQARADLRHIAEVMSAESGSIPAHKDIVKMLETIMREEAEEYGYEAPAKKSAVPVAPTSAKKTEAAQPVPASKKSPYDRSTRTEMLKRMESGNLDD